METRNRLVTFLDALLLPAEADPSNNGLQVEGAAEVRRAIFAVDASQELFDAAVAAKADFIAVHHGLSWRDNLKYLTGLSAARLRLLLGHGISLYASHLPLDAHPEVGNNAVLARDLGLADLEPFFEYAGVEIGCCGAWPQPRQLEQVAATIRAELDTDTRVYDFGGREVRRVGVVSGGGADAVFTCRKRHLDCLLTGEFGHEQYHSARELRVSVIAAGHYATETGGIRAVMERVQTEFSLDCSFVDLPTGL